jgi:hypothetical protein
MNTFTKGLVVCVASAGVAVGLAGPASAEPPSGSYTGTMIDGGGIKEDGSTAPATFGSCGPDCVTLQLAGPPTEMRRNVMGWTAAKGECTWALQDPSLVMAITCPGKPHALIGFTKN